MPLITDAIRRKHHCCGILDKKASPQSNPEKTVNKPKVRGSPQNTDQ